MSTFILPGHVFGWNARTAVGTLTDPATRWLSDTGMQSVPVGAATRRGFLSLVGGRHMAHPQLLPQSGNGAQWLASFPTPMPSAASLTTLMTIRGSRACFSTGGFGVWTIVGQISGGRSCNIRFKVNTLNRVFVQVETSDGLSLNLPLVNAAGDPFVLPVTPTPMRLSIASRGDLRSFTLSVVGPDARVIHFANTAAVELPSQLQFLFVGGNGNAQNSEWRGGIDDIRFLTRPVSDADFALYGLRYIAQASRLATLSPAALVFCIGTSLTDGWYCDADNSYPAMVGQQLIDSALVYNWGWAGRRTSDTNGFNLYAGTVAAIRRTYPDVPAIAVLEFGANDAQANGGPIETIPGYQVNLIELCAELRAAGVRSIFKCTSTPMCFPLQGNDAIAAERWAALQGFVRLDRQNLGLGAFGPARGGFDGVIDIAADPAFTPTTPAISDVRALCQGPTYAPVQANSLLPSSAGADGVHDGPQGVAIRGFLVGSYLSANVPELRRESVVRKAPSDLPQAAPAFP